MNIHHLLLLLFFSALCGGDKVFTGPEGGDGTISCYLTVSESRKFFCKDKCNEGDILIRTDGDSANNGRYSMTYKARVSGGGILSVTIAHLTPSDSGRYRCGVGSTLFPVIYQDFEVRVSDGLLDKNSGFVSTETEGDNGQYPCVDSFISSSMFFCRGECKRQEDILIETDENSAQRGRYNIEYVKESPFGQYVTITQLDKSDSGQYMCGYGTASSPVLYRKFSVLVVDAPASSSHPATVLFWFLLLLVVSLLVFYQWKKRRNSNA